MRLLNIEMWNSQQAPTQFQGQGKSHELASLILTEVIQFSLHSSNQPVYALYLDAQSDFDCVVRELLVRSLYFSGTTGQSLLYFNERLNNRLTYCEWDRCLMGPIADTRGVEQGGVTSPSLPRVILPHKNLVLLSAS